MNRSKLFQNRIQKSDFSNIPVALYSLTDGYFYFPHLKTTVRSTKLGSMDEYGLKKGGLFLSKAMSSLGVDKFILSTKIGNKYFDSLDDLSVFIKRDFNQILLSTVHIFGSIKSESFDKVHGPPFLDDMDGRVLISDASILSEPLGVNTQLAVMVIGKWVAELCKRAKN